MISSYADIRKECYPDVGAIRTGRGWAGAFLGLRQSRVRIAWWLSCWQEPAEGQFVEVMGPPPWTLSHRGIWVVVREITWPLAFDQVARATTVTA